VQGISSGSSFHCDCADGLDSCGGSGCVDDWGFVGDFDLDCDLFCDWGSACE
jgi:hypothetical protein